MCVRTGYSHGRIFIYCSKLFNECLVTYSLSLRNMQCSSSEQHDIVQNYFFICKIIYYSSIIVIFCQDKSSRCIAYYVVKDLISRYILYTYVYPQLERISRNERKMTDRLCVQMYDPFIYSSFAIQWPSKSQMNALSLRFYIYCNYQFLAQCYHFSYEFNKIDILVN